MTIYRVQDADGRGPWKPGFPDTWVEPRQDHENLLPFFCEFGMVHRKALDHEHLGVGCLTVRQLQRWFTPTEFIALRNHGYAAVRIEADRILAQSDVQCVFANLRPLAEGAITFDLYEPESP